MVIKLLHSDVFSTYFVTFTCIDWIPLFQITDDYDLVYKWFRVCKEKYDADILAYVIMPNHMHFILHFHSETFNLNVIGNGKRFLAYELVERLIAKGNHEMTNRLQKLITHREKEKGQIHKVFKDSFDAKPIYSEKFLYQKVYYIHVNPVSKKWQLATDYIEYEHSSASFYETGEVRHFRPLHFQEL